MRVNFILDEFGNLPHIPAFDKKLTVAAGRGMRFLLAVQDLAQIKARYKEASQTIMANCATWVYLATADVETAKVISAKTGQYTVATESYSSQVRYTDHSQGSPGRTWWAARIRPGSNKSSQRCYYLALGYYPRGVRCGYRLPRSYEADERR